VIPELIRGRGRVTVAAFMELALHHPTHGYYARAPQRSGRGGDFFTSVDVGPLFGELLAEQIAEMAGLLNEAAAAPPGDAVFDLVEAGAGNGRLMADVLRALRDRHPSVYSRVRPTLVETSHAARAAQGDTLRDVWDRSPRSAADLPTVFEGVLVANELLDAMPVHQVVMRDGGLQEVYVEADPASPSGLRLVEDAPSSPELAEYLKAAGAVLEPGWRAEINLCAAAWVRRAAQRLRRGFMILIDYGHDARDLYSESHAQGTLTTYAGHRSGDPSDTAPPWLQRPGERDITAHVDFTSIRRAAEAEGLVAVTALDQTYFILGLLQSAAAGDRLLALGGRERSALKTLIMPGGLGSTLKVLVLGKGVGMPALRCASAGARVT
jgi:SAM-dependent MidA family methyltransferase